MNLRVLSAAEVRQALPMAEAIAGMKLAYAQLSTGRAVMPLRSRVDVTPAGGSTLIMPAFLPDNDALAVKVVSVFPGNAGLGLPTIHAAVLALDPASGRPLALLEGGALTAIRTGAASGAATDLLARPGASRAAIFGSGIQARTQLEAVCTVRHIQEVRLFSLDTEQAHAFAAAMAGQGPIPAVIHVAASPEEALQGADIICTATTATTPVFPGRALAPGSHVNAIGSFLPSMQEIDAETVRRALVVVDERASALAEAGDLIIPLARGEIEPAHIRAELGEIVAGKVPGRENDQQITLFKSVGVAVQDAVAAAIALSNAARYNLGTVVSL